ncbi:MAG TPA: MFS transporter [Anaerolineales bacterium]|nr:MFS transporter [Anaerolineales bacterium]HNN13380.1 MFS transporter [Anaerolineales bacterium]HNO31870.1 MFS transporter [Anaerolineales bacterium]
MTLLMNHPLIRSLRELKGNPRAAVLTELLFGIPYNLFAPFFSVYMIALGMTDQQIGGIASFGLVLQVFSALVSGAIVDKFGRRLTLFIGDLLCWSTPCLVWAIAQDVRYFAAAAALNSLWRISLTAWTCLMVEDAEERHLVHIWTWIMIFAVCSAFFAPIGGWFVNRYGLVPAVRGLFVFGFIVLTVKAVVLFLYSHETVRGVQRREETRHRSLLDLLSEYRSVLSQLLHSRAILAALSLMVITNIYTTVSNNFWGVLFTTKLGFAESQISLYVALRSIVMTSCFFLLGPSLTNIRRFRRPLWIGFGIFIASQAILVYMPPHSVFWLSLSVILEGVAAAFVNPMTESLLAFSMESNERARVTAMVYVALILAISPFGWVAGQLSALDRSLPFALNMVLFAIGAALVWWIGRTVTFTQPVPENG